MAEKPSKKTTKKSNELSQSKETQEKSTKKKEPLVSTKKKVGIAVYFTFLATLAGVMGVQMLINNNTSSPTPADNTTAPFSTTVEENPSQTPDTYSNFPINEQTHNQKVATPFDIENTQTENNFNSAPQPQLPPLPKEDSPLNCENREYQPLPENEIIE